jgi:hypothetical protein
MEVVFSIVIGMVVSLLIGGSKPSSGGYIQKPTMVPPSIIGKPPNRGTAVVKERGVKDNGI